MLRSTSLQVVGAPNKSEWKGSSGDIIVIFQIFSCELPWPQPMARSHWPRNLSDSSLLESFVRVSDKTGGEVLFLFWEKVAASFCTLSSPSLYLCLCFSA